MFPFYFSRFYSIIAPGDTVNVIGEFDEQGKCDVNRDNSFLIVHPDTLVSGTRVLWLIISYLSIYYVQFSHLVTMLVI